MPHRDRARIQTWTSGHERYDLYYIVSLSFQLYYLENISKG